MTCLQAAFGAGTDRIYDAIFHGELPYGLNGITMNDKLKRWMLRTYPEQRPAFLFSRHERIAQPVITLEAGHALLVEREALKSQLEQCRHLLHQLQVQEQQKKQGSPNLTCVLCPLNDRAETTYLNIIGAMLDFRFLQPASGEQLGEPPRHNAVGQRDAKRSPVAGDRRPRVSRRLVHREKDASHVLLEHLARSCEACPPGIPFEQPYPQFRFQFLDRS